jgi:hypothetical protein
MIVSTSPRRRQRGTVAAAAVAVLLLGCGGGEDRSAASVPSRLDGVWELSLQRLDGLMKGKSVRGRLTLRSEPAVPPECRGAESTLLCRTAARGTHSLRTREMLRYDLSPEANAGLLEPDSVSFLLGACCDRGEISGIGRWKGETFHGRWMDQRLGGATVRGVFTLRPIGGANAGR